jgi:hypothetical protein
MSRVEYARPDQLQILHLLEQRQISRQHRLIISFRQSRAAVGFDRAWHYKEAQVAQLPSRFWRKASLRRNDVMPPTALVLHRRHRTKSMLPPGRSCYSDTTSREQSSDPAPPRIPVFRIDAADALTKGPQRVSHSDA